jgi:hypothetical protein
MDYDDIHLDLGIRTDTGTYQNKKDTSDNPGNGHGTKHLLALCGRRCKDPSFQLVLGQRRRVYLID